MKIKIKFLNHLLLKLSLFLWILSFTSCENFHIRKQINNTIGEYPSGTELSFGLVSDSNVMFYGCRNENGVVTTIGNHTSGFEIGSITKTFTTSLMCEILDFKQMNVNEKIGKYIEINDDGNLTFKNLANHTSGLPRMPLGFDHSVPNPYNQYPKEKFEDLIKSNLNFEFISNKEFNYSNFGIAILGYALCEIMGREYGDLLNNYFFDKYNMSYSTCEINDYDEKIVKSLDYKGNLLDNWSFSSFLPAGGVVSNAEDLCKYILAHLDEKNWQIRMTHEENFKINDDFGSGLGWRIDEINEEEYLFHYGRTAGYYSSIFIDDNNKKGIVILTNISFEKDISAINELIRKILKLI